MCVGGKPRQNRRESLGEAMVGEGGEGGCYPAAGLGELHHGSTP